MLTIFNRMYLNGKIMGPQKHGIIVRIPKTDSSSAPADYRPITLLNTDYTILALMQQTDYDLLSLKCYTRVSTVDCQKTRSAMGWRRCGTLERMQNWHTPYHVSFPWISQQLSTESRTCISFGCYRVMGGYSTHFSALINAMYDLAFSSVQSTFYRTMFRQARLSDEHATLRLDLEAVAMCVGTLINGNKNWTQNPENGGCDARRCHDFCDCTTRHETSSGTSYLHKKGRRVLVWTTANPKRWQWNRGIHH
jgi:hypothetical protein